MNAKFTQEIKKAKESKWREFVEGADNIWKAKKYLENPVGATSNYVPSLEGYTMHRDKAKALQKAFFPQPPAANLKDLKAASYPRPVTFHTNITLAQVRKAVNKLSLNKAPDSDEINNKVLKNALSQIELHL